MKSKGVKEKTFKEHLDDATKRMLIGHLDYARKLRDNRITKSLNEMPPTILDDDIADWEHDNLVEEDDLDQNR